MALISRRTLRELGPELVLAPERYDPRRAPLVAGRALAELGALVRVSRETLSARRVREHEHCLVLDTTHAREGMVERAPAPAAAHSVASAKNILQAGDLVLSRLRPYLRQVAWIDAGLFAGDAATALVGSTEFVVLRPADARSIAFLMPFLLCESVQSILAASQEGGHHPRVREASLIELRVPARLIARRDELSKRVESVVARLRKARSELAQLSAEVEDDLRDERGA